MGGFTLLEVILALALLVALIGAVVLNLPGFTDSQRLEEGAYRLATMLSMARTDAANLGRRVRVAFEADEELTTRIRVLWEADPLGAPDEFTDYTACTWGHYSPAELVRVTRSELVGPSAYRLLEWKPGERDDSSDELLAAVTFYPDGSCDSAVIELESTSDSDQRVGIIEMDGLIGSIDHRILTPSELADRTRE
ncbi:MAG: pilus assembly FimT family protein [Planctomycetota bacterium]|jgi:hypothetical protein